MTIWYNHPQEGLGWRFIDCSQILKMFLVLDCKNRFTLLHCMLNNTFNYKHGIFRGIQIGISAQSCRAGLWKGGAAKETGVHLHGPKKSSPEGTSNCPMKSGLVVLDACKALCFLKSNNSRSLTSHGTSVLEEAWHRNQKTGLAHLCHVLTEWPWHDSHFTSLSLRFSFLSVFSFQYESYWSV